MSIDNETTGLKNPKEGDERGVSGKMARHT